MAKYSDYKIINSNPIGSGGNAYVYLAKREGQDEEVALKLLKNINGKNKRERERFNEKKERFCIESKLVQAIQSEVEGIIPIYDSGLPDENEKGKFWYVMPIAEPIKKFFLKVEKEVYVDKVVKCIVELADVMNVLHSKGIVHRDIKPSNIYYYKNKFCFGDFGLVDYPDKEDLTKTRESVGAKSTIAPEMKYNAKNADGKKADVYSLAKTLWMLLTKSEFGFEGTYDETSKLMGLSNYYRSMHLVEIEELLFDSTREEPELRPSMKEFKDRLIYWVEVSESNEKSNLSQWTYVQKKLFGENIPDSASWSSCKDIVKILNLLGRMPNLNHMFIPTGGGIDLNSVGIAAEEGFIVLNDMQSYPDIVKPKKLIVENIERDYKWSYFRLELEKVKPIFEDSDLGVELLTEDYPGHYISWKCGNYGYYENDKPLPKGYRLVNRYTRGNFVIFLKTSIYNHISGTYDARHNKMSSEEFREHVEMLRNEYSKKTFEDFIKLANINPIKEENEEFERPDIEIEKMIETSKYIVDNFKSWNFKDLFKEEIRSRESKLAFGISFIYSDLGMKSFYLSKSGKLIEKPFLSKSNDGHYLVYDRKRALELIEECERYIKEKCIESGVIYDCDEVIFEIDLWKIGKPTHMFTKDELRKLLIGGDDSKHNYLVIDENGVFKLLQSNREKFTYPVRFEGYGAYNNYVGKYSELNHLDDQYIMALEGWLHYLTYDTDIHIDYKRGKYCEQELIAKIKQYY